MFLGHVSTITLRFAFLAGGNYVSFSQGIGAVDLKRLDHFTKLRAFARWIQWIPQSAGELQSSLGLIIDGYTETPWWFFRILTCFERVWSHDLMIPNSSDLHMVIPTDLQIFGLVELVSSLE